MVANSLRTVAQLAEELPAFDEAALRRLIFYAEDNGFEAVIVRIGRKVLIDMNAFNEWLESHRMRRTGARSSASRRRVARLL